MKCSFCDNVLTPEMVQEQGCGVCLGGCRKIHCPYCGQENPIVPELIDKILIKKHRADKKGHKE